MKLKQERGEEDLLAKTLQHEIPSNNYFLWQSS